MVKRVWVLWRARRGRAIAVCGAVGAAAGRLTDFLFIPLISPQEGSATFLVEWYKGLSIVGDVGRSQALVSTP